MTNKGNLWIIPNEENNVQPVFEKNVQEDKSHTYYIQKFVNNYKLGFDFKEEDYHAASCEIAKLGYMVVKSEDDPSLVICYLPEKITDRQYNWLYQNSNLLYKYMKVKGYFLKNVDEDYYYWEKVYGLEEILIEARKNNISTMKGKVM